MSNYSLGMLKPDAIERGIEDKIYQDIESGGLNIVFKKRIKFTPSDVNVFYEESMHQPYFNDIQKYITRGIVEIFIIKGRNSVDRLNDMVGSTNPETAKEGTLRKKFGKNILENTVHSSEKNRVDIEINYISKNVQKDLFEILSLNDE